MLLLVSFKLMDALIGQQTRLVANEEQKEVCGNLWIVCSAFLSGYICFGVLTTLVAVA